MATKKKSFAQVTANALRRPKSMGDFLSDNDDTGTDIIKEKQGREERIVQTKPSADTESSDVSVATAPDSAPEKSLDLSEQTTFYLDLQVCEILDSLWIRLRQKAPKGRKKRISKSLIVNRMVEFCNNSLENDGLEGSKLVEMIFED